jgi:large subunit ribosomal protein L9
MKIVLRQDVPKLGESGTIQQVKNGYARNYLIPRGMAVLATDGEIKVAEHNLKVRERKVTRQEEQLQSFADKIDGQRLEFTAIAGAQGRLFGSVTSSEIADQLAEKIGEEIDRRKIQLTEPLRTVGEHAVEIHLVGKLRPTVTVAITAEASDEDEDDDGASDEATELSEEDTATSDPAMDSEAEAEVESEDADETDEPS